MPAWKPFKKYRKKLFDGTAPALGATPGLRMLAATAAFNPETSALGSWTDFVTFTVTDASGYGADGEICANETVTLVTAGGTVAVDFDDVVFGSAAAGPTNIRYFIVVTSAATTAASSAIAWTSAGSDKSVQSGSLTVQLDADGMLVST